ncbi:NGCA protein, partial [Atrichornis clamosus]|nr:NGCA protein [Atrichornis clamosus]
PPAPPGTPPQPGVLTVLGDASGVVLGGLHPWSRYRLQVLVFNGRGAGPPSAEIHFHTPEGGETPDPDPQIR